jgi:anti-sigma B factor antagonist/stage II sporulation protein AA (anti-sigma F factor antagonist)
MTELTGPTSECTDGEPDDRTFRCSVEHDAYRCTVALHGELDLRYAPALERRLLALLQLPLTEMVVDLTELSFIDSTGLTSLVRARHAADEARIAFTVCHATERVEWMLALIGLEPLALHAA